MESRKVCGRKRRVRRELAREWVSGVEVEARIMIALAGFFSIVVVDG